MGTNNRDRRRQKKRRQAAAERARERRRAAPWAEPVVRSVIDADDIERMLADAVSAYRGRDVEALLDLEEELAHGPLDQGGPALGLVDEAIARSVRRAVAAARDRGWEQAVLARYVRRRLDKAHVRVLDALDNAPDGVFIDELARGLRTGRSCAVHYVVQVLAFVSTLPPLPKLRSAERARPGVDGRILRRVRALLAKAESTTFPEEAEALSAKAQELMARHAIDRALLEATADVRTDDVTGRRILIDDPYAKQKYLLLGEVAEANRCAAVWSPDFGWVTVFGAEDDLDIVELLFTSLLCQATSAMTAAGSATEGALGRRARTKSFRQSFLVAYATRIGVRLRSATEAAAEEAAATHGADRLLPVLAERKAAAEEAAEEAFPHISHTQISAHDAAGWAAGAAAADVASLDVRRAVRDSASELRR